MVVGANYGKTNLMWSISTKFWIVWYITCSDPLSLLGRVFCQSLKILFYKYLDCCPAIISKSPLKCPKTVKIKVILNICINQDIFIFSKHWKIFHCFKSTFKLTIEASSIGAQRGGPLLETPNPLNLWSSYLIVRHLLLQLHL